MNGFLLGVGEYGCTRFLAVFGRCNPERVIERLQGEPEALAPTSNRRKPQLFDFALLDCFVQRINGFFYDRS
jgi:hypothetical protein